MSTQQQNINRVRNRIGPFVLRFVRMRWRKGKTDPKRRRFYAADLNAFVLKHRGSAPASADRILRDLRSKGWFRYKVVNRAKSRYKIVWVLPKAQTPTPQQPVSRVTYHATYQFDGPNGWETKLRDFPDRKTRNAWVAAKSLKKKFRRVVCLRVAHGRLELK